MKENNTQISDRAFDYDSYGHQYASQRQTDPRIAEYVYKALGDAATILNVGAGAGSYEPKDKYVIAVEPSAVMRSQRLDKGKTPAVIGSAESLPFDENSFDASMAMVTIHHWPNLEQGLKELRRVTKGPVIILTFDPDSLNKFWNAEYFPDLIEIERRRFPSIETILSIFGSNCEVVEIPIPLDCMDGFQEAFYGRPEAFLESEVRKAQSAWGFLPTGMEQKLVQNLADALKSGEWDKKYGHYREAPYFTCALRLIIARP